MKGANARFRVEVAARSGAGGNNHRSDAAELGQFAAEPAFDGSSSGPIGYRRMERQFRADSTVFDCTIRRRPWRNSFRNVCYVVPLGTLARSRLDAMAAQFPEAIRPNDYVVIDRMPLTPEGRIDEKQLFALAVIDPELLTRAEAAVRLVPELVDARLKVEQRIPSASTIQLWHPTKSEYFAATSELRPERSPNSPGRKGAGAILHGETLHPAASDAPKTLDGLLRYAAKNFPDRGVAYIDANGCFESFSYSDLHSEAARIAGTIQRAAPAGGSYLVLQCDSARDFIAGFWGGVLAKRILVPLPVAKSPDPNQPGTRRLLDIVERLGFPPVLACRRTVERLGEIRITARKMPFSILSLEEARCGRRADLGSATEENAPVLVLSTSGSTGSPKLVVQTHRALLDFCRATTQGNGLGCDDSSLNWMPMEHIGAIADFHLRSMYVGANQVHVVTDWIIADPIRWLTLIDRYCIRISWAPNFAFGLVNRQPERIPASLDLSRLRFLINAGETVLNRTVLRFCELLKPNGFSPDAIRPTWGMSETCSGMLYGVWPCISEGSEPRAIADVGCPIPGTSVRIVDAEDRIAGEGAVGRLQVRGSTVMRGYFGKPTVEDWFDTGDLASIEEGRVTIVGRAKEVIILNGANYSPAEIQSAVEELPGMVAGSVAACGVRASLRDSEALAIFIGGISGIGGEWDSLVNAVRQKVAERFGVSPDFVVPCEPEEIARTRTGKIQHYQLARRFEAGEFETNLHRSGSVRNSFHEVVWRPRRADPLPHGKAPLLIFLTEDSELGSRLLARLRFEGRAYLVVRAGKMFEVISPDLCTIGDAAPADWGQVFRIFRGRFGRVGQILCFGPGFENQTNDCGIVSRAPNLRPIEEFGDGVTEIRTETPYIHSRLTEAIDAMSVPLSDGAPRASEAVISKDLVRLLKLIRALQVLDGQREYNLLIATRGIQGILPNDDRTIEGAGITAIARTVATELNSIRVRHVDLEGSSPDPFEEEVDRILNELEQSDEREVAWRGGSRLCSRLRQVRFASSAPLSSPLRRGGFYLITGGLGGVGRAMASHLLKNFEAKLLLVGRTAVTTDGSPAETAPNDVVEALRDLSHLPGRVLYRSVDVTDPVAIENEVSSARESFGCTLDGVIHLAAEFFETPLGRMSSEELNKICRAKFGGLLALGQVLERHPDAALIVFSSAVSFLSAPRLGGYAMANCLVEAYAARCRSLGRNRVFAYSWTPWQDIGMSRGVDPKIWSARGFQNMPADSAVTSLQALLERGISGVIVGLDERNANIRRYLDEGAALPASTLTVTCETSGFPAENANCDLCDRWGTSVEILFEVTERSSGTGKLDGSTGAPMKDMAASTRFGGSESETARRLRKIWEELLGIHGNAIEPDGNFFALGGHSLLAVELMVRIETEIGCALPVETLVNSPTLRSLASSIDDAIPVAVLGGADRRP